MTNAQMKQKLSEAHDFLFEAASKILSENNPCGWHKTNIKKRGVQLTHACIGMAPGTSNNNAQCCCERCPFWDHGCTAEKPLACKTWLCTLAHLNTDKGVVMRLNLIRDKAEALRLYVPRGDKAASLAQATQTHTWYGKLIDDKERNRIKTLLADPNFLKLD